MYGVLNQLLTGMSLSDYLAKNYLNADAKQNKQSKKRKRRVEGLVVADDEDNAAWKRNGSLNENEDGPVLCRQISQMQRVQHLTKVLI